MVKACDPNAREAETGKSSLIQLDSSTSKQALIDEKLCLQGVTDVPGDDP